MTTTPASGRCQECKQIRPLFDFEPCPEFWEAEPPVKKLCTRCHSRATVAEEAGEIEMPVSWLIDHGTDEQVARAFGFTR